MPEALKMDRKNHEEKITSVFFRFNSEGFTKTRSGHFVLHLFLFFLFIYFSSPVSVARDAGICTKFSTLM
jgi:hypothetical protein